jgi:hypothetical protein
MKRTGLNARALTDLPIIQVLIWDVAVVSVLHIFSWTEAQRVPDTEFSHYTSFESLMAPLATCSDNLASSERLRLSHASVYKEDESGIGEPDMGRGHSEVLRHRSLTII